MGLAPPNRMAFSVRGEKGEAETADSGVSGTVMERRDGEGVR